MTRIDRRHFLVGGAATALTTTALTTAGCTRSSERAASDDGTGALRWWDHFGPLQALYDETFAAFADGEGGVPVEHTVYNASEMAQALQLARKSSQMPDVFSNVTGLPDAALVADGWVQPLPSVDRTSLDPATLIDGLHTFDGDLYSLPLFTARQYTTLNWFNTDLVEKAGGDPDNGPATWDDFRALARAITADGTPGWVLGLAFTERVGAHVVDLAQTAGQQLAFAGGGYAALTDPSTGEYPFGSDAFAQALEFLQSLVADGVMLPASTSLDAKAARARWAAGGAGFFFDGPWNAGSVKSQFPDFLPTLGVGQVPTPDGTFAVAKGPAAGVFWIAEGSGSADEAGRLMELLTTPDVARGLAEAMDQPPADLDVVASADVEPSYARAVELMSAVTLAPTPVGQNPAVATVVSSMQEVRPDLGEITQGFLGGDIDDVRSALTDYAAKLSAERDRALADVVSGGAQVSLDDWVFSDYQPGSDYTAEQYS